MGHAKLSIIAAAVVIGLTGCGGGSSSSVEGNVPPPVTNTAPVANAGSAQTVAIGSEVTVSGSASSDADGDTLTYLWEISEAPDGSAASLSDATAEAVTFTPDITGAYTVSLVVNDGTVSSSADEVVITAEFVNNAPTADAGVDREAPLFEAVTLDGSGSDDVDGDTLSYTWVITSAPANSTAALSNETTVTPSFTPDVEGNYVISLVVSDGVEDSEADSVTINAVIGNSAPIADAGAEQSVAVGEVVQLENNSSDPEGDVLTSQWSFTSVPEGSQATLSDATADTPTFTADVAGSYVVSLVVNDGMVDSAADSVSIDAVEAEILLFRKSGSTDNYFPFPVGGTTGGNIERVITENPLPASVAVQTFRLQAIGSDYTVTALSAIDQQGVVTPFFDGLEEGVIAAGEEVTFSLSSPLTGGEVASLVFTFTIEETGQTFTANYAFSTTTP